MKQEQFIEEQVKNIFKVSKQLYSTFRGIKKLTMKYLIKITKLKAKKKAADAQRELLRKKQEIEKRRKKKIEEKKLQKQMQNKMNALQQNRNVNIDSIAPQKSIMSIINDNKVKLKSNRPKQQKLATQLDEPKKQKKEIVIQKAKEKGIEKKKVDKPTKTTQKVAKNKQAQQLVKVNKILQKPVEPESPYYRFLRMKKNQIRSSMNNIPMEKTSQIMKNIWDKMKDDEKRQYVQSYEIDKAKYQRDAAAYFSQQNAKNVGKKEEKQTENQNQPVSDFDFIDELDKM